MTNFTIEDFRKIVTTDNVKQLAEERGWNLIELYNVRTHFQRFCGINPGYIQQSYRSLFEQLKKEGIKSVRKTPTSPGILKQTEVTNQEESVRDPVAEIEIAFNQFKEKLNELIPLIVDELIEEKIRESMLKNLSKSGKKVRILR